MFATSRIRAPLSTSLSGLAVILAMVSQSIADERGKKLVELNCARCHAIGRDDSSRHPEAPAFRDLHEKYTADALEKALAEGISVGQPDMP